MAFRFMSKILPVLYSSPRTAAILSLAPFFWESAIFKCVLGILGADVVRKYLVNEEPLEYPEKFKVVIAGAGISGWSWKDSF